MASPGISQLDDTQCFSVDTPESLYTPSQESHLFSPVEEKSPRKKLKEYLSFRDVSPVRSTLSIPWENASERTKRFYHRKAQQVVHTCLEEIAPGQSAKLLQNLGMTTLESSSVDCVLMHALSLLAIKMQTTGPLGARYCL